MSDFFRTKNGFEKCILSQIEVIRHWNKKTNFITTCRNSKLELTEDIGKRDSFFRVLCTKVLIDYDYVSDFMIQGKVNKDIKNVLLFNNMKYI